MNNKFLTLGIDVGGSYIKAVLIDYADDQKIILSKTEKIRKRNPVDVADELVNFMLKKSNLDYDDISYIASTGEGEMVEKKTGHFYSMTTHARGGLYFNTDARTVVDMGALFVRAIKVNDKGKVLDYKMTGQCASGSGQFIENISRYLGLAIEEVGDISLKSAAPETPSGICAVLAETDVINMVSRGIATPDIIKGIHLSIANRVVRLLSSLKADSPIVLTGGMAMNKGMVEAIRELSNESKHKFEFTAYPESIYAGAVGAALWGGFRYLKLKEKNEAVVH
ncbi:MAG: benzoyl-CoA reductase subunit D [Ignavibacteriota bacterium]|nr:MAG: benzoyl-CoA reductase subunit D [Chlorobiota bacterium]MBE7476876.1 benzoyl-CoA reductase subunit D [Ignavibacteriales bacterium]MBL1121873.1 benzoyl-CoA reductase subunit D [Ignavibacteriota bacterium]MCZ7613851.1 benzoyl-CoA reductase subunit D [Ignavibacteriaceae bacterium]MEB2296431.1 benzoyl-CoA reductase subunit D [Ignavibacteria bacterium]